MHTAISRVLLLSAVASLAACGGSDVVLPSEGTAATISITKGNNQNGTVNAPLADSLVVRVLDEKGRPVPDQPVSWSVLSGGGSVSPVSGKTDADGRAGAKWTLGPAAGAQQAMAKPTGNGAPDTLKAVFTATAGASTASNLALVSGDAQTAVAGSPLPDSLVVKATDGNGNPVAGVEVTWVVVGGGAVSSPTVATGPDGRSAVKRTLGATAGAQSTTASATGLAGSPVTFAATATVGSAGQLAIIQQPSATGRSGLPLVQQPKVQIQDGNGNLVNLSGISVAAQIASGPAGSSLSGIVTVSTNAGTATFQNLGISGPAGSYTLNFTVPNRGDISGTPPSSAIVLSAGAPAQLAFSSQPTSIAAGGVITPAVTVLVEDALGNLVSTATNAVTVALGANPGSATLGGTKTVNASGGVATFSTLTLDRPGTGYTLGATGSGLSGAASNPFNVSAGAATQIAANSATTLSGTAGSAVSPLPSVKVTDGSGNGIAGVNVTFAVTQGGGSVSGATQTTDAGGIATVGNWVLGPTAGSGNNQMTASASGLTGSPVTFTASAAAGTAGKLLIATQPASSGTSGAALSPQPVIQLADINGNPVTTGGVQVTATIASGPGGSLTNATKLTSAGTGQAVFSGLAISGPSGTYTLSFSGPSLTGTPPSNDIVIGAGSATKLAITTPPPGSVVNGQMFATQPVIQLEDASGNPVGASGVTVTASLVPSAGATLTGDLTKQTNSNGQAFFTDLGITGAAGSRTVLFAASGLTSVSSDTITVTPGPVDAAKSGLTVSASSLTAGDAGIMVTVTARDQSNNTIPDSLIQPDATNGGTFNPNSIVSDGSGQGTFTYTTTVAGSHVISAIVGSVTLNTTRTVTVQPAAVDAAQSSLGVAPGSIAASTGAVTATATVTARDPFGNTIPGQSVLLGVTGAGNTISTNPVSTNAGGVATFTISSTSQGVKTITASIAGTTIDDTPTLTVAAAAPDATSSEVTTAPTSTTVGTGVSVAVTFQDQFGNPVGGQTVTLASDKAGNFGQALLTTDINGQASTSFTPTEAGTHTISAQLGSLVEQTTLTVSPGAPDAGTSTVTADSPVGSGVSSIITVTVKDANGNPIQGANVTLAETTVSAPVSSPGGPTDVNGVATGSFSSSTPGDFTIQATVNGATVITQTASIHVQ